MEPIQFPQVTVDLQKPAGWTDDQCLPLPVYSDGEKCMSLWAMTWHERISALFFGRVWLYIWSGRTQPPVTLWATRDAFIQPAQEPAEYKPAPITPEDKQRFKLVLLGFFVYMSASFILGLVALYVTPIFEISKYITSMGGYGLCMVGGCYWGFTIESVIKKSQAGQ